MFCWGGGPTGRQDRTKPTLEYVGLSTPLQATLISVGENFACAVRTTSAPPTWYGRTALAGLDCLKNGRRQPELTRPGPDACRSPSAVVPKTLPSMPVCWGASSQGETGTNSTVFKAIPTSMVISTQLSSQWSAGLSHACAIASDNQSVWCWG